MVLNHGFVIPSHRCSVRHFLFTAGHCLENNTGSPKQKRWLSGSVLCFTQAPEVPCFPGWCPTMWNTQNLRSRVAMNADSYTSKFLTKRPGSATSQLECYSNQIKTKPAKPNQIKQTKKPTKAKNAAWMILLWILLLFIQCGYTKHSSCRVGMSLFRKKKDQNQSKKVEIGHCLPLC